MTEEVKVDTVVEPNKEMDYLRAQLAELGKNLKEKDEAFTAFKKTQEDAKLTADEKTKKDLEEAKSQKAKLEQELVNKNNERDQLLLTARLISEYNLASVDLGPTILAKYDAKKESIEEFAKRMQKDPVFSRFFKSADEDEIEAPTAPSSTHSRKKQGSGDIITEEDKEFAAKRWRGDTLKQEAYLKNLRKEREQRGK